MMLQLLQVTYRPAQRRSNVYAKPLLFGNDSSTIFVNGSENIGQRVVLQERVVNFLRLCSFRGWNEVVFQIHLAGRNDTMEGV